MDKSQRSGRPHKAFVITTDTNWRAFRAIAVERGEAVQDFLGVLVEREVKAARRRKLAAARDGAA